MFKNLKMSEPMIIANKYNETITDLVNDSILEQNDVTVNGQVDKYYFDFDKYVFVINCYTFKPNDTNIKQIMCFVDPKMMVLSSYIDKKVTITGKLKFWYDRYNNNYQIVLKASKLDLAKINNDVVYFTKVNEFIKNAKPIDDNIEWYSIKNILYITDKESLKCYDSYADGYVMDDRFKISNITCDDVNTLKTKEVFNSINYGFKYFDMIVIFYQSSENINKIFNKQSIINSIKNSPIPIITSLDNTNDKITSAIFATKNFPILEELFEYLLGILSENGLDRYQMNKTLKVYFNRLLKNLIPDLNKYLDMVDQVTTLFLDPNTQTEVSTFNEVKKIMCKFFDTFIIDADRLVKLSDDKILRKKCLKLKEFMDKKNIKKTIKIIDDLMKDLDKYVSKYGKSKAGLLQKTDDENELESESEPEIESDSDY